MSDPLRRRIKFARFALLAYRERKGDGTPTHLDDRKAEVSDLIADLLHYARGEGMDVRSILFCAESNAGAEVDNLARAQAEGLTGDDLEKAVQG